MREFTDEESNFAALLQRAMDLEGVDRDVVYQLVALLMKVMLEDLSSEDRIPQPEDRMQQSQDWGNCKKIITSVLLGSFADVGWHILFC